MTTIFKDIFDYIFKKRTITFLGRAGLYCYYNDETYFIDSEMLVGPLHDIVIYSDNIYLIRHRKQYDVDETIKSQVLDFLKLELQKRHIKFQIS